MMEDTDTCNKCYGTGRGFYQVDESHRTEIACPLCDGTGKGSIALAKLLTMDPADKLKLEKKIEEFHKNSWQAFKAQW